MKKPKIIIICILVFFGVVYAYFRFYDETKLLVGDDVGVPELDRLTIEPSREYGDGWAGTDYELLDDLYSGELKKETKDKFGRGELHRAWMQLNRQVTPAVSYDVNTEEGFEAFRVMSDRMKRDFAYQFPRLRLHWALYEKNKDHMSEDLRCQWSGKIVTHYGYLMQGTDAPESNHTSSFIDAVRQTLKDDFDEIKDACLQSNMADVLYVMVFHGDFYDLSRRQELVGLTIRQFEKRLALMGEQHVDNPFRDETEEILKSLRNLKKELY